MKHDRLRVVLATLISLQFAPLNFASAESSLFPAPYYKSEDGSFSVKAIGRVFQDFVWASDSDKTFDISESETRTARIGFDARWKTGYRAKAEAIIINGEINFTEVVVSYSGDYEIKLGQFKLSPSLSEATSGRFTTFMERAHFTDAFQYSRALGVGVGTTRGDFAVAAAIQKGTINDGVDASPLLLTTRAIYAPEWENIQLHFAGSVRYRNRDSDGAGLRYRQRPHSHLLARYIDTGQLSDSDVTLNSEFALIRGSFSLQGEYAFVSSKFITPLNGQSRATFSGGYIGADYYLTGETRDYSASKGSFGGQDILKPLGEGGYGAFQITTRFEHVDLNDSGISGGIQDTVLLGLNWSPNQYSRVMVNYANARIKRALSVAANGVDGSNSIESVGVRLQLHW